MLSNLSVLLLQTYLCSLKMVNNLIIQFFFCFIYIKRKALLHHDLHTESEQQYRNNCAYFKYHWNVCDYSFIYVCIKQLVVRFAAVLRRILHQDK